MPRKEPLDGPSLEVHPRFRRCRRGQLPKRCEQVRLDLDRQKRNDRAQADPGLLRIIARVHDFQERLSQDPDLTVPAEAAILGERARH
jgi:hypothetical protein